MPKAKIAITLDAELVRRLDRLVRSEHFLNRSRAIEMAVEEKLARMDRGRLARECAKLDPAEERRMAEEGMAEDARTWPAY